MFVLFSYDRDMHGGDPDRPYRRSNYPDVPLLDSNDGNTLTVSECLINARLEAVASLQFLMPPCAAAWHGASK